MPADFAPDLNYTASGMGGFRFWCQKTLPLVYDDSLSYYELLCKLTKFLSDAVEDISTLDKAYKDLEDYVNDYFDSLDVQQAIDAKLDEMALDGTLGALVSQYVTRNKDVVIITASYGSRAVLGSGVKPFTESCKERLETNSGIKCYYGYKSGASFSGHITSASIPIYYDEAITMALSNISSEGGSASTIGQVIIVGGGNDVGASKQAISDGMERIMPIIKSSFPNAIVRFAWASWLLKATVARYDGYNETITIMKELCGKHGIGYCHNSEFIFHQYNSNWYKSGDNLHPSQIGSDYFADGIVECILTGSCDCVKEERFIALNVDPGTAENPFITRPASTQSDYHYPLISITDFVIRQVNENTYVIPGRSQYNPTFILDSGFMGGFGRNPASMTPVLFGYTNSNLLHCVGSTDQYGGFPVTIFVHDEANTICNTVNGLGKILNEWDVDESTFHTAMYLNCVMDSTYYNCGTGGRARIYMPEIVLPTAFC